jgi:N-acyl-D-aspartate/D-glutamate deacylase
MSSYRWDIVIRGAHIFDGTGATPFVGSLAVRGDRIAAVGEVQGAAALEIDAGGLALAPGFIDVHSHDDFAVLTMPTMDFKLMQGVTTEAAGNCGWARRPTRRCANTSALSARQRCLRKGYRGYLEMVESAAEPQRRDAGHTTRSARP